MANQYFLPPCMDKNNKNGSSTSAQYAILYDLRQGAAPSPTYLQFIKDKKNNGEYYSVIKSEKFRPMVDADIAIITLRDKDTLYTVNSKSIDNYLESQDQVVASLTALNATAEGKKSVPVSTPRIDTTSSSKINIDSMLISFPFNGRLPIQSNLLNEIIKVDSLVSDKMEIDTSLLKKNTLFTTEVGRIIKSYVSLLKKLHATHKESESKVAQIKFLLDSIIGLQKNLNTVLNQVILKAKLLALFNSLQEFNNEYSSIDFKEGCYKQGVLCLRNQIEKQLSFAPSDNSSDLAQQLINLVKPVIDQKYYKDFNDLITLIQSQYQNAISKKSKYGIFYYPSVKVPNADSLNISIKKSNSSADPLSYSFATKGGLKIDFSTGVFISGLGSSSFVLGNHSFRYKVTNDTILPSGKDSITYTGLVRDTSGNLIHENRAKLNYNVGFLIHVYSRTGGKIDVGGAIGAMIDNNSKFLFAIGPSVMFKAGKSRISLVGGAIWGQENQLTSVSSQYKWDPKSQIDNNLYNSKYEVPRFYTGSNEISTYTKGVWTWFVGFTFNFGSTTITK